MTEWHLTMWDMVNPYNYWELTTFKSVIFRLTEVLFGLTEALFRLTEALFRLTGMPFRHFAISCFKHAHHNTPSGAFYIIGVIMFLLLCMCFPFIYGRDDNTLFVTCIYSVFTSYFFRYRYALQQAIQIRQAKSKKFRSISNCFNAWWITKFRQLTLK